MYAKLRMELDNNQISYRQSSKLQGVLMEHIDTDYAERLHQYYLNPYSQYVVKEKEKTIWCICTMNQEAYEKVILPMAKLEQIQIRRKEITARIEKRTIETVEDKELIQQFYTEACDRYLNLQFFTPTSFKRDGKYVIYPDLRLIYGSLMRKYSAASEELDMYDEETLEELVTNSEIIRYRLQTMPFPLEKVQINGFVGSICIKIGGTETMANYIRLLSRFGEYSGVGIKTSMGMGAMRLLREDKNGR